MDTIGGSDSGRPRDIRPGKVFSRTCVSTTGSRVLCIDSNNNVTLSQGWPLSKYIRFLLTSVACRMSHESGALPEPS